MSSFNDKIEQIFAVLSTFNTRQQTSTKAIEQLKTEIAAVKKQITQEQEDLRQIARQYAEWREQVQKMQADIHLILQHLGQEMEDGADGGKER